MNHDTNTPEDIKPFTVRLPRPLNKRLGKAAADLETTKQAIVEQAVEVHLDRLDLEQDITGVKAHGKTNQF